MPVDFDELDAYFADFAVEMTLHGIGGDRVIDVLFSEVTEGNYMVQNINSPRPPFVLVKTEDVTELDRDHPVTINGLDYNMLDILPDGTGFTNIPLERNHDAG